MHRLRFPIFPTCSLGEGSRGVVVYSVCLDEQARLLRIPHRCRCSSSALDLTTYVLCRIGQQAREPVQGGVLVGTAQRDWRGGWCPCVCMPLRVNNPCMLANPDVPSPSCYLSYHEPNPLLSYRAWLVFVLVPCGVATGFHLVGTHSLAHTYCASPTNPRCKSASSAPGMGWTRGMPR